MRGRRVGRASCTIANIVVIFSFLHAFTFSGASLSRLDKRTHVVIVKVLDDIRVVQMHRHLGAAATALDLCHYRALAAAMPPRNHAHAPTLVPARDGRLEHALPEVENLARVLVPALATPGLKHIDDGDLVVCVCVGGGRGLYCVCVWARVFRWHGYR